jgi:hypothetical protein
MSELLHERGTTYGTYKDNAAITQELKDCVRAKPGWERLSPSQRESMEMICSKIGRILNGNPDYIDSWQDIGGYAELIVKELNGEKV